MNKENQASGKGNKSACAQQHQSRPKWAPPASFMGREFKVLTLSETPLPGDLYYIDTDEKAVAYWRGTIEGHPYLNSEAECLVVLALDTRRHVKGHQIVTVGILDNVLAHAREVFRGAIVGGAYAIILMHNHPSGCPTPSEPDIRITRKLREAGEIVGIEVLDHIIMGRASRDGDKGYCSLRSLGYFSQLPEPRRCGKTAG